MKKIAIIALTIMFGSCNKGTEKKKAENPEKKAVKIVYEFFGADGKSSVNYGGQIARLAMANEIKNDLRKPESTLADLENKFNEGLGFSEEVQALNTSGKKIVKTVTVGTYNDLDSIEKVEYKALLKKTFADFKSADFTKKATNGLSGALVKGDKKIYVTARGIEQSSFFAKLIIGSMCLDQVVNKYLNEGKLKEEYNTNNAPGKNYTKAQHHWDEAYGYVFGKELFLGKYLLKKVDQLNAFKGIKHDILQAFIDGRQALVAKEYNVVKIKADFIKEELSKVVSIRTISYLQQAKGPKDAATLHFLSEALGFVYSLRFVHVGGKQLTAAQVDGVFAKLGGKDFNLWTVTDKQLDEASQEVSRISGISIDDALLLNSFL